MASGDAIVVPVVSPASVRWLVELAARLAGRDGGIVWPLSVVAPGAGGREVAAAEAVVRQAEAVARSAGARASGLLIHDRSVAAAVMEALERVDGSLTLMGWQGMPGNSGVFGELVDSIVTGSHVPLLLVRHQEHMFDRVLVPIPPEGLQPHGSHSLELAADLARRLAERDGEPVTLVQTGEASAPLPERILALTERVHHDPRRVDRALSAIARPADLVVLPVAPTTTQLRAATTELAWAVRQAWLMVVVAGEAVGEDDFAEAVRLAGSPPPTDEAQAAGRHEVVVTVACRDEGPSGDDLVIVLAEVGSVTDLAAWSDRRGRAWRQAAVYVDAPSSTAAVGAVMTTVANVGALADAEVSYEVMRRRPEGVNR